jgi:anti-sigma factor RsiW
MTSADIHQRTSERLGAFERGELTGPDTAEVQRHLEECPRCRAEHRALSLLAADDGDAPLTEEERSELRAAVARQMRADRTQVVRKLPERRDQPWARRAAAALGIAAFVAAGGFFVINSLLTGEDAAELGAGGEGTAEEPAADQSGGPMPVFAGAEAPAIAFESEEAQDETAGRAQLQMATPPYDQDDLIRLGRSHRPFVAFARAYTAADAGAQAEAFLEKLASRAPSEPIARAVRECGREVLDLAEGTVLPAYAEVARVDGRRSLILGFVFTDEEGGPLDRYWIWAWEGPDCADDPPTSVAGEVEPAS